MKRMIKQHDAGRERVLLYEAEGIFCVAVQELAHKNWMPWEVQSDGWRDILIEGSADREEAEAMYEHRVRWIR